MKVSLYGVFPPNIGGVAIHIKRLSEVLRKDSLLDCIFVNNYSRVAKIVDKDIIDISLKHRWNIIKRFWFYLKYISKKSNDIIHIHGSIIWDYVYILLSSYFSKGVVLTVHDQMQLNRNYVYITLIRFLYSLVNKSKLKIIAVNQTIAEQIKHIGIKEYDISIIPAYIPIADTSNIKQIKSEKNIHNILWYAPSLERNSSENIYRFDLALSLKEIFNKHRIESKLIICAPNGIDYEFLQSELGYHNLIPDELILFDYPINNMSDVLSTCNLYFRPTMTDGDSLLIRDALHIGCHVIASDEVARPLKTILFSINNQISLEEAFKQYIHNEGPNFKDDEQNNNFTKILSLYNSFNA